MTFIQWQIRTTNTGLIDDGLKIDDYFLGKALKSAQMKVN